MYTPKIWLANVEKSTNTRLCAQNLQLASYPHFYYVSVLTCYLEVVWLIYMLVGVGVGVLITASQLVVLAVVYRVGGKTEMELHAQLIINGAMCLISRWTW